MIRVYWEDTDAGGIVFYANYLKFMERARTEWLRSLGIAQQRLRESTGGMFVVSQAHIQYHRPARLDDRLLVTTRLSRLGAASMTVAQCVFGPIEETAQERTQEHPVKAAEPGQNRFFAPDGQAVALLCGGDIRIGWVNAKTLRPARIPCAITATLARRQDCIS
ncbi:MAG: YbgC/FadM family acyl-CoA thioesterase [Burkholderiaceae bacterium]|nr:YbgC/FadM family acyl-CoA thioesterase [Burkholderiaceae bacterium]